MKFNLLYRILLILLVSISFMVYSCDDHTEKSKASIPNSIKDSVAVWIKASKDASYTKEERLRLLQKSYGVIQRSKIDSSALKSLSSLAFQNYILGDTLWFKNINNEVLRLAEKSEDLYIIGDAHWNYASYFNDKEVYDSAYFHFNLAHTYFDKGGYLYESAKVQYGMAFVKSRFKDYSGSEVLIFNAIPKFEKLKDYKSLYSCYDLLGQLQNDIYEYDKALEYYNESITYANKVNDNPFLFEGSLNNIGYTYLKKGEFAEAIGYFDQILNNKDLKSKNVNHYARVLSNKAYCLLRMRDTAHVADYLYEGLHIRDSLNNKAGVVASEIYLAEYYIYKQDSIQAIHLAKEANEGAHEIKNSADYLETLLLLAKLEPNNSRDYFKRHIHYSDSLQKVERKIQNKFARIAYETDGYIEKAKRLSQQRIWISVVGISAFSILGLLFFLRNQRSKHEKLQLEYEQQKANEQIYLITLKQQERLEKERIEERNRIAEELHDGILGKLFGTRVGLGFLPLNEDQFTREKHSLYLEELQNIEKEIREVSHKLSDNFEDFEISFPNTLKEFMETNSEIGNFKYELRLDEEISWDNLDDTIKVNLFRITQESIQNIIKYASANTVCVSFLLNNGKITLEIKDDGQGFNLKQKKKGIGLKNMKSRVKKLKGVFSIHSLPNEGTTISIQIPI
ncbi:hypothetical protein EI546_07080 [Aequorivita sp. H23M31]|uniref:Oxygen sensor histidine kinase NreB n=1 Tax=Aequorivita ciconiae TaxID=2494375 RepID=A0A410G2M1_9FLAO|nr:sensor histidine kinase [Aequorivita sp. H23M31]QAA81500.1 hypothetical protein EI546_07080 [Aequorivita sp. H23M31]